MLWVVFLCRLVKYIGHFRRYPTDLKWLLIIPIVGYIHSCVIKPYALFTLKVVSHRLIPRNAVEFTVLTPLDDLG